MELEEAIKYLEEIKERDEEWLKDVRISEETRNNFTNDINAIKTVLQALDNSIPKEKIKKVEKYCKSKSIFQTFGDEQLKRTIEMYVNKAKSDVLNLLEE